MPFDTVLLDAAKAAFFGGAKIENALDGYTGEGYVSGFTGAGDACEFVFDCPFDGFFDVSFIQSTGNNGYKENYVFVNGQKAGDISAEGAEFAPSVMRRVFFNKGENIIRFEKYWGWTYLDGIEISASPPLDRSIFDISPVLVNQNADASAKRLFAYLTDVYGEFILSGQYCDGGLNGKELFTLRSVTGKTPAILGLDLIEYTPSRAANGSVSKAAELAREFHEAGGIVTMCWHWNAPEPYLTGIWWRGFYSDATNINLKDISEGRDQAGYDLLIRDIDAIAEPLKVLRDAGVPVLWRPLHEASGGWFWWGASGAEPCVWLWNLLYVRLTNYHKLNNLIWLWNGQNADWYPGNSAVDIIGEDIYAGERVYSSQAEKFFSAVDYAGGKKLVALSECGTAPDPDLMTRDGAMWSFFAVWSGEFVLRGNLNRLSEQYTEEAMFKKIYSHEKVLTLEDLPDFSKQMRRE